MNASSMNRSGSIELAKDKEEEDEQDVPARALVLDMDVSASPALQCLDEMFSSGRVSLMKVARLKASYKLLHDTLRRSQASEEQLLQEAHRSRVRLEELRAQEVQAEEGEEETDAPAPPPPGAEGTHLRQQLLRALNEQEVTQRRESTRRFALERLLEEKLLLEKRNVKRQSQPVSLDALRERREELTREVAQRELEVRNLTDEIKATRSKTLQQQKELEHNKEVIEKMQAERAQLLMVPNQLLKEMDRVRHRKADAEQKVVTLEAEAGVLKEQLTEAEGRQRRLEEERRDLGLERRELGAEAEAAAEEHREALRGRAVTKEKELSLLGERDILAMKLMDLETDSRLLNESQYIQLKEKDRQLRASRQMELVLKQATDQLVETQSVYSNAKSQRDAWLKGDIGVGAAQRRAELQREVDALKANLKHQHGLAEEGDRVEQQAAQVQALIRESGRLSSELHSLGRLTQIKTEERDQKHRQLRKAEQTKTCVGQECRENALVIMDLQKLQTTLQHRISQRDEACSALQGERNRHQAQLDIVSREIAELMEKSDGLDIELENLRRQAIEKDRTLAEARKKHSQNHKCQESLCKDISKVDRRLREMQEQSEEHATEGHKLGQDVAKRERSLITMNQSYQAVTRRRDALGIQLLECDAESSLLNQKHNRQGAEVAAGNAALDALEEEVRMLRLDAAEEQRCVGLGTERATHTRGLKEELDTLLIELSKVRVQVSGLDSGLDFSGGEPPSVLKELQGSEPPTPHLIQKTQQLEERLAKCEEQLMEKELLLDQVTRLSQPIREQVDNGQQERLQMARKLNALRAQNSVMDQRLMAVAAELSMRQAQALVLEREARERHLQVEACERRCEQGLPPCLEVEEQWRRLLRDRRRKQKEAQEREERLEEEGRSQLPDGVYTTAEPRPNAYIPSQGPLLLPRPYGALAPFKPSEPGANIRHIRKPRLKPIEK